MVKTLALLDSALVQANLPAATGSGGFPLPATWMGGYTLGRDDFVKLVNTHKARFRTAVARTKAARDGVDWGKVLAEAEAGLDHDIDAFVGGASGWSIGFQSSVMHIGAGWSQLSMMYYGFADTSGAYQTWLQLPLHQRGYILLCTPDLRWPRGCTRPAQQATSPQPSTWTDLPYIGNRLDPDVAGEPWGNSYYQNQRYVYIRNNSNTGQYPEFLRAENDMLVAEAAIRLGQFSKAAARIDIYRSHAGLPLLTGAINDATTPVPGGNACVPKVPDPDTKVLRCGALMEAMKYEKRMETAFNRVGAWYFDSRGWGDLIEGTPLEYPLPVNEIDARYPTTLPYYNLGGGGPSSAPRGTYGFP